MELDRDPDLPPLEVIQHWQRTDRMFAEEMKLARASRAEVYHERVMEIANNAANLAYSSKEDLANAKLAVDTYKWGAEKGNPERYSSKVVHEGSTEKPIVMRVINTGISRNLPDVVISKERIDEQETEAKRQDEESESAGSGREQRPSVESD